MKVRYWNEKMETMPREKLEGLQLRRLRKQVRYAHSKLPLYKRRFKEAGVRPDDIRSLEDLQRFPFTVKNDLRDHYPYGILARPLRDIVRITPPPGRPGPPPWSPTPGATSTSGRT